MNIVFAYGRYKKSPPWGGIDTYLNNAIESFRGSGHEVRVLYFSDKAGRETRDAGGVVFQPVKCPLYFYRGIKKLGISSNAVFAKLVLCLERQIALGLEMRRLEKEKKADVVEYPDSYAPGFLHRFFSTLPWVVRIHMPYKLLMKWYSSEKSWPIAYMEDWVLRHADTAVFPTESFKNWFLEEENVLATEISVVPNPINTKKFLSEGKKADSLNVCFVGWLRHSKGFHILTNVMESLLSEMPSIRFVVAGGIPEDDKGPGEYLLKIIAEKKFEDRVIYRGFLNDEELIDFYREAAVIVVPSLLAETFGYSCLEAMASGVPVIASSLGGLKDLVEHGVTGLLINPGDVRSLNESLRRLLINQNERHEMGLRARDTVTKKYNYDSFAKNMTDAYMRTIEQKKSSKE